MKENQSCSGFTLIELLLVVAIIGILASTATQAYSAYKEAAGLAVARSALHDAVTAYTSTTSDINLPPNTGFIQTVPGAIGNASGRQLLPGFMVPKQARVSVAYNPGCISGMCINGMIRIESCLANRYYWWVKFGSGDEILMEPFGATC